MEVLVVYRMSLPVVTFSLSIIASERVERRQLVHYSTGITYI